MSTRHSTSLAAQPTSGLCRLVWRFLNHTHPLGLLWLCDQHVSKAANCSKQNKHKRWTSMPSAGFETTITAIKGAADLCLRSHSCRNRRRHISKQPLSLSVENTWYCREVDIIGMRMWMRRTYAIFFQESPVKEVIFYSQTHIYWGNSELIWGEIDTSYWLK